MKFKTKQKGLITQGYNQNLNPLYKESGRSGHSGIDYVQGYGAYIPVDNTGYVYKVYKPQQLSNNWTGVYMLVPYGDDFMEICLGHLSRIFVEVGDTIKEGQIVGREGNFGDVYSGGVKITPEMQDAGDKRGHHVHESWRPVRRVKKTKRGGHYLNGNQGRYKDDEGYYYEIIEKNGVNGCIDPLQFHHIDSVTDRIRCYQNRITQIASKLV